MKEVTIDNVRERIAELDCLDKAGVISLRGGFELACLRMLVELQEYRKAAGEPVAFTEKHEISNMHATGLYLRAWPGDRARNAVEGYTIPLYTTPQPAPAVEAVPVAPDADPSLNAMMRALDAFYADDADVPEQAMLTAFKILLSDVRNQAKEPATDNTAQQFEALATSAGGGKQ